MNNSDTQMSVELVATNFVDNLVKDTNTAQKIGFRVIEQIRVLVGVPTLTETKAKEEAIAKGTKEPEAIEIANSARKKFFNGYKKLEAVTLTEDWVNDAVTKYRATFKEVESDTAMQYASHIKNLLTADARGYRDLLIQCLDGKKSFQTASRALTAEIKKIEGSSGNSSGSGNSDPHEESDSVGHSTDLERGQMNEASEGFDCTDKRISDADFIAMKIFVKACGNDAHLALQIAEKLQAHASSIIKELNEEKEDIKKVA